MATQIEKILAESKANLERGRAAATGIGVFAVVFNYGGDPLLRRRLETDSLYGQDLSGKWEMTGGGVEIPHLENSAEVETPMGRYQGSIFAALAQELEEEAGLRLLKMPDPIQLIPAWLWRPYEREGEERISIDLAFSLPIPFDQQVLQGTDVFQEKLDRGELMFVPRNRIGELDIVSPRTRFLIEQTLRVAR